jgi:predicted CopG family antitoxin
MTDRIRTTISISPEVYEIFKRMAQASNSSVSRIMGDWLDDTADAANLITLKMEEAKQAPMKVMNELKAMVVEMSQQVDSDIEKVRRLTAGGVRAGGRQPSTGSSAPSSNTGLNYPPKRAKRGV